MEELIDNDILISMVETRPVLWDKNGLLYKDRFATKTAWAEVCCTLFKGYDEMSEREQNELRKAVIRRWTNLRDVYSKYVRKAGQAKQQGIRIKKYAYDSQLQFLAKFYESKQSPDDEVKHTFVEVHVSNDEHDAMMDDEDNLEDSHEIRLNRFQEVNITETPTQRFSKRKRHLQRIIKSHSKKRCNQDAVEVKQKENPHLSFFHGVLPHLQKYNDEEVLEFQTGVLRLISTIDEKRKYSINSRQLTSTNYFNSPSTSDLQSRVLSPDVTESSEISTDFGIL